MTFKQSMISAIIVEDDPHHSKALADMLLHTAIPVHLQGTAIDIASAYAAINKLEPELVFLDIDLGMGESGFDLLRKFDRPEFCIIFTTQHSTAGNAIAALRACALDFLPKPVMHKELDDAIKKYAANIKDNAARSASLRNNLQQADEQVQEIWIRSTFIA